MISEKRSRRWMQLSQCCASLCLLLLVCAQTRSLVLQSLTPPILLSGPSPTMSFDRSLSNATPVVTAASSSLNVNPAASSEPPVSSIADSPQVAAAASENPATAADAALSARRLSHTSALLRLLHSFQPWNMSSCVSDVARLLASGVESGDPQALLHMSLADPQSSPPDLPALYSLLRFYTSMGSLSVDSAERRAEKTAAQGTFVDSCRPLTRALLRSYPGLASFRMPVSGNSLLSELYSMSLPSAPTAWLCELSRELCLAGLPVDQRNSAGLTALLIAARGVNAIHTHAIFVSVLADCGADLNAQDDQGNGLLHTLVRGSSAAVLVDLLSLPLSSSLDLHLQCERGLTAADLATQLLLERWDADRAAVARTMDAAMVRWSAQVRAPVLAMLTDSAVDGGQALIPDLAQLVLSYVDNSGRPFKQTAEETEAGDPSSSSPDARVN